MMNWRQALLWFAVALIGVRAGAVGRRESATLPRKGRPPESRQAPLPGVGRHVAPRTMTTDKRYNPCDSTS